MESEFLQLAREAVAALQGPSWVEIAQLAVSGGGLCAILVGLKRMGEAGHRRDREIDELGKGLQQQGQALERQGHALERQGAAMTQALTQQGEALGKIGQALDRQGAAMTKAFTQQGEVLAELLRRTA